MQERVKHRQHIYISIHTPTRGVTREKRLICKAAEENDTDCYKRAAEDLRFYKTLMEEKRKYEQK